MPGNEFVVIDKQKIKEEIFEEEEPWSSSMLIPFILWKGYVPMMDAFIVTRCWLAPYFATSPCSSEMPKWSAVEIQRYGKLQISWLMLVENTTLPVYSITIKSNSKEPSPHIISACLQQGLSIFISLRSSRMPLNRYSPAKRRSSALCQYGMRRSAKKSDKNCIEISLSLWMQTIMEWIKFTISRFQLFQQRFGAEWLS